MNEDRPSTSRGNPSLHISIAQRGGQKLIRCGYEFVIKRKNKDGTILWRCTKKKMSCFATIKTTSDFNVILNETNHCHAPMDVAESEIKIEMDKCLKAVQNNLSESIPKIFEERMATLRDRVIDMVKDLPALKNVQKTLYKKRNKYIGARKVTFAKAADVEIPEKYKYLLLADYRDRNKRIIIFADEKMKNYLRVCTRFFIDGTFKICPKAFYQLFTIHADLGSNDDYINVIPVIYALLPDKKMCTYELLFQLITSQITEWNPSNITMDFEVPAIIAVRSTFPDVKITGCYFHFVRSLWRKAKELGLSKTQSGKNHIKLCAALSHLPSELTDDGWLYVMEEAPNNNNITKFNDYFVKTWLENSTLRNTWCTFQQLHKTNNVVETWNGHIQKYIKNKPNIAQLLDGLGRDVAYYSAAVNNPTGLKISKTLPETAERKSKINCAINQLLNGQITLGHCLEKIKF